MTVKTVFCDFEVWDIVCAAIVHCYMKYSIS